MPHPAGRRAVTCLAVLAQSTIWGMPMGKHATHRIGCIGGRGNGCIPVVTFLRSILPTVEMGPRGGKVYSNMRLPSLIYDAATT